MHPKDRNRRLLVDLLAALFGLGSWISVNGMFNQLPLLVQVAPEEWSLPSYLSILIQMANIGPVLYFLSKRNCGRFVKDSNIISGVLFLGTFAMLYMAFYYSETSEIFGKLHSTSLMIGTFFIALVGCTSSVLFFPFMGQFPEYYLVSFMVGEGLSGFIPSGLALVQGIGDGPDCVNITLPNGNTTVAPQLNPPRISVKVFFLIIFAFMVLSFISFIFLNNLSLCEKERKKRLFFNRTMGDNSSNSVKISGDSPQNRVSLSPFAYGALLILQTVISFLSNGSLPSLQSYSCLPYGNEVYHLSVTLVHIANPVACFIAFFLPHKSMKIIVVLSSIMMVFVVHIVTLAALSPHPPLYQESIGKVLVVFSWTACSGIISYTKLSIASLFNRAGGKGLFWYGACVQLGAALGAASMFILINVFHLFHSSNICESG